MELTPVSLYTANAATTIVSSPCFACAALIPAEPAE